MEINLTLLVSLVKGKEVSAVYVSESEFRVRSSFGVSVENRRKYGTLKSGEFESVLQELHEKAEHKEIYPHLCKFYFGDLRVFMYMVSKRIEVCKQVETLKAVT